MGKLGVRLTLGACAVLATASAAGLAAAADGSDDTAVEDLHFGEVLFHFYQEDYFSALVKLLAAQSREKLSSRATEAQLLSGGLYLSYGQHRKAGEVFESVLAQSVAPNLHDRAWFFLANIWYQRGYLAEADAALARIGGDLTEELEPDRRMLHAQVLMDQARFSEALTILEAWPEKNARWVLYAKYNVGVALVRLGRIAEGAAVLDQLGQSEATGNPEIDALRDKANVALGFAWLQADAPAEAKLSLQRVRMTGPFSNQALLGVGWSDAELDDYRAALAPWSELRKRDLLDAAVQESLLAVPYAYARLGAQSQAADFYSSAIASLSDEIDRLNAGIEAIRDGQLISDLLAAGGADGSGWYWRLDDVPDTVEARYLYQLISTHRFQEALKIHRDLLFLNGNLNDWAQSLSVFDDILDTKQRAFESRLPVLEQSLAQIDIDEMNRRRVALESQLSAVERAEDFVAVATADEQRLWRDLKSAERGLMRLGTDARANELRDKHRLLSGLLVWDLRREYKVRLWRERRSIDELVREIRAAERLDIRVRNAKRDWPEQFVDQSARVTQLRARVDALRQQAQSSLARQQQFLHGIAVDELLAQRERLGSYLVQAQFSLAAIYDRAANATPAGQSPVSAEGGP